MIFAMMQEIKKLHEKLDKVPGAPPTLEEASPESFADSPFVDSIARAEMPKKFSPPIMKPYDGTADPVEHVSLYKHKVEASSIPADRREICMCRGFGSTLTGAALTWYINIPLRSVKCFADLVNLFNHQFASSRQLQKRTSDLYRIKQGSTESLRNYLARFNKEKISIPKCDRETAVEAYRQGLIIKKGGLYEQLTMYECHSFDDAQAKTLAFIRLEEDANYSALATTETSPAYSSANRKAQTGGSGQNRPTPYSRPARNDVNAVNHYQEEFDPPIHEYNFSVSLPRLVNRLEQMGPKVRWPRKNDRPDNFRRDTSKWCDFHGDIGHLTEDCNALRKEVAHLLKRGYLQDLINKSGTKTAKEAESGLKNPEQPPTVTNIVHFISGGSEVCGLTYSAAKRTAREKLVPPVTRPRTVRPVTFDESDLESVPEGHHDSLVIRMQIGTAQVSRILIDGGSSVNIIMVETLGKMGINIDKVIKKSNVLVGFSGESKNTVGEIELPTYAEGVNSYERFCVLDCPSSYNIILGRPWIHNVKAVPSTFHQCVKIPSDWGTVTIRGEHQTAQECYMTALKPGNILP